MRAASNIGNRIFQDLWMIGSRTLDGSGGLVGDVIGLSPICALIDCQIKTIKGCVLRISSYIGVRYLAG